MFVPKRTKYRKPFNVKYDGEAKGNKYIAFGDFALVAKQGTWVTSNQLEACRVTMVRQLRAGGKLWIRIFPHNAKTKKPIEVRMGSGKGNPESWVAVVKKNSILFEIGEVDERIAREALRKASHKLPIQCQFIKREGYEK